MVDRWIEANPNSMFAGVVAEMREIVKRKNLEIRDGQIRGLF